MRRRARLCSASIALGITLATVVAEPASAVAPAPCDPVADYNGDGYGDLAIGIPDENIGSTPDAGAVQVLYGGANGLTTMDNFWSQASSGIEGSPESDDSFGGTFASGDFDGDGITDLAIGAPGEAIGSETAAGSVHVLYGTTGGLGTAQSQFWSQATTGVADAPEFFDLFGSALTMGDFNGDDFDDLAIGAAGETLGAGEDIPFAGVVHVLYGSAGGLSASATRDDQRWMQGSNGVEDAAEETDLFGIALGACDFDGDGTDDLAIGSEESSSSIGGEGAVNVIYGASGGLSTSATRADQLFTQGTSGVAGDGDEAADLFGDVLADGDFNGDGYGDLAVGVPGEDVGSTEDAGAVNVIYGSSTGLTVGGVPADQFWTQNSSGVLGSAETGDGFGSALAAGQFGEDTYDDLAIGVPMEDTAGVSNAGVVAVLRGSGVSVGLTATNDQVFSQGTAGVPGSPEAGDRFGETLAAGDMGGYEGDNVVESSEDLAIGVPRENAGSITDSGAVEVLYGGAQLGTTSPQLWDQNSAGIKNAAETGDHFGDALA